MHVSGILSIGLSISFSAIFFSDPMTNKSVVYTAGQEKMPVQEHFLPFHSLMVCIDGSIPLELNLWFGELQNYRLR